MSNGKPTSLFSQDFKDIKFFVNIGHNKLLATKTLSSLWLS